LFSIIVEKPFSIAFKRYYLTEKLNEVRPYYV